VSVSVMRLREYQGIKDGQRNGLRSDTAWIAGMHKHAISFDGHEDIFNVKTPDQFPCCFLAIIS